MIDLYQKIHPGPFTTTQVVNWAIPHGLMPVPTIRDSQIEQDGWDIRLADVATYIQK